MDTHTSDIASIARHLLDTQGPKAIAEAAQKAESYEKDGDEAQAQHWRRVEAALREMRGPRQT